MKTMNDIDVIINDRRYTICGFESSEYLQKVASYINSKYSECQPKDGYNRLNTDMNNILIQINIADDYFKIKKQLEDLSEENEEKGNELFQMKHDIIAAQTKINELTDELDLLKEEYNEAQKKIVRLETALEEHEKYQQKLEAEHVKKENTRSNKKRKKEEELEYQELNNTTSM